MVQCLSGHYLRLYLHVHMFRAVSCNLAFADGILVCPTLEFQRLAVWWAALPSAVFVRDLDAGESVPVDFVV